MAFRDDNLLNMSQSQLIILVESLEAEIANLEEEISCANPNKDERDISARRTALQHCVSVVISANKESAQKALVAVEDVLGVANSMAEFLLDGTVPKKKFER